MQKLFIISLLVGAIAYAAQDEQPSQPPPIIAPATTIAATPTTSETTMPPETTTTSTTTATTLARKLQTAVFEPHQQPEWIALAQLVGWPSDALADLDYVIQRESRGKPDAWNRDDPAGGSRGLTQINGYWCQRTKYNSHHAGFLGQAGVLDSCDDLFDPETNLRAALAMYRYGVKEHGCGWGPWQTRKWKPCR